MTSHSLLIIGFGNSMMGDDGIGPAVVGHLSRSALPASVTCLALSDILHLPAAWSGQEKVWMIDAIFGGAPPGTIHRFGHDAILSLNQQAATVHHLGLAEGLRWILHSHHEMGKACFSLFGVEPKTVSPVEFLSVTVEEAVRQLADEIFAAIQYPIGSLESSGS